MKNGRRTQIRGRWGRWGRFFSPKTLKWVYPPPPSAVNNLTKQNPAKYNSAGRSSLKIETPACRYCTSTRLFMLFVRLWPILWLWFVLRAFGTPAPRIFPSTRDKVLKILVLDCQCIGVDVNEVHPRVHQCQTKPRTSHPSFHRRFRHTDQCHGPIVAENYSDCNNLQPKH